MGPTRGQSAPNAPNQLDLPDADVAINGGTPRNNAIKEIHVGTVIAMGIDQIAAQTLIATVNVMRGVLHAITLGILAALLNLLKGKT